MVLSMGGNLARLSSPSFQIRAIRVSCSVFRDPKRSLVYIILLIYKQTQFNFHFVAILILLLKQCNKHIVKIIRPKENLNVLKL